MLKPEEMLKRQQVLAAFGEFAIRSESLDEVLMEACRLVGEATGTGRAKVLEIQEGRKELLVRAGVGWAPDVVGTTRLQMSERSSETYAIEAAKPIVSQDISTDDRFEVPPFMREAGVVALVNVPIFVPGRRPYGVLQVDDTKPRAFGDDEIEFLRTYAMILGPVIDRLHLVEARAKDQEQLKANEARLNLLIGSWAQAEWETDANGVVITDSPSWRDYTGQTLHELRGYGWLDAIHPDDRAYAEEQWREVIAAQGSVDAEFRLRSPDGGWRWTNVRAVPVVDEKGLILKWVGMNINIDDRKSAEAALRKSEAKYRSLFESIDEGFCIIEMVFDEAGEATDYVFLETNPVFEKQASFQTAPGQRMREIAPDHEQFWFDTYGRIALTGEPARFEHRAAAIGVIYDVYAFRIDKPEQRRVAVLFRDITARKRTEEQLRALVTTGTASTYRMSADWRLMFQLDSRTLANTTQPIENWVEKYIPDQDLPGVRAAVERAIRTKSPFEVEHRVLLADGTVGWMLSKAVPVVDEVGAIIEWFGTGSDVTERRAAVEQVRQSELKYATLFSASPVPTMALDPVAPHFVITSANEAYIAAIQTTRETLVGRRLFDVFPDDPSRPGQLGARALNDSLKQVLETKKKHAMGRFRYDLVVSGEAEPHWWEGINAPILDASGEIGTIIHQVTRVTEQYLAEQGERENQERQVFLLNLSDALGPLTDPFVIQHVTARLLGEHLHVGRCAYGEIDDNSQFVTVHRDYHATPFTSVTGRHEIGDFGVETLEALGRSEPVIIEDAQLDLRVAHADLQKMNIRSAVVMPLVRATRIVALLTVQQSSPRTWQRSELQLIEEVVERTWETVDRAVAEQALRESEERLRQFGEASQDVLWIRNANTLTWEYLSPAFEAIYGLRNDEALLGDNYRNWVELIVEEDREHAVESINRVGQGETLTFEYRVLRPIDGEVRWLRDNDFPMLGPDGQVKRIGGVGRDVTELKRIEEALQDSERRLRVLRNSSGDREMTACGPGPVRNGWTIPARPRRKATAGDGGTPFTRTIAPPPSRPGTKRASMVALTSSAESAGLRTAPGAGTKPDPCRSELFLPRMGQKGLFWSGWAPRPTSRISSDCRASNR